MPMPLPKVLKQYPLPQVLLLLFGLVLLGVGAMPSYITGKWPWMAPPDIKTLKELKELQKSGLTLPGWETIRTGSLPTGGHTWWRQDVKKEDGSTEAMVLLLAGTGPMKQPQVEWMDINGYWRWSVDSMAKFRFIVETGEVQGDETGKKRDASFSARVEARFFRGWTGRETFAVLQWYAFPDGGHPAPSSWFWRDRISQLNGDRVPWVAASIIIPMEPLGDVEKIRPLAESLGKTVQAALMAGPLRGEVEDGQR